MALRLRLRAPDGQHTLSIAATASIADLLAQMSSTCGIPSEQLEIRNGFPVKIVTIPSDQTALASSVVRSGDTLVLAQKTSSSGSAAVISAPVPAAPQVSQPKKQADKKIEGTHVRTAEANLVIRVVPDDNSCLFRAAGLVLLPEEQDAATKLRRVVADKIRSDPQTYSDAILGQPREAYISSILNPKVWGGYTELAILSSVYNTEIAAIDIASGRIDRYGESFPSRVLLLYSGIHYDACTLSPLPPEDFNTMDFDTRTFPKEDETVLIAAVELAGKLKEKHYYTDTANFSLRCEVCRVGLVGEKEATAHAKATGHASFGEY